MVACFPFLMPNDKCLPPFYSTAVYGAIAGIEKCRVHERVSKAFVEGRRRIVKVVTVEQKRNGRTKPFIEVNGCVAKLTDRSFMQNRRCRQDFFFFLVVRPYTKPNKQTEG